MTDVAQILDGGLETTIVMPFEWEERDANEIGQPVVIGDREHGFVGAIQHERESDGFVWTAEQVRRTFGEADEDVKAHAAAMKLARKAR